MSAMRILRVGFILCTCLAMRIRTMHTTGCEICSSHPEASLSERSIRDNHIEELKNACMADFHGCKLLRKYRAAGFRCTISFFVSFVESDDSKASESDRDKKILQLQSDC